MVPLLALDPDSNVVGWAQFEDEKISCYDVIKAPKNHKSWERIRWLGKKVRDLTFVFQRAYPTGQIVMEWPDRSLHAGVRNTNAWGLAVYGAGAGYVAGVIDYHFPGTLTLIPAEVWTRGRTKPARQMTAKFADPEYDPEKDPDAHKADAIALGVFFLERMAMDEKVQGSVERG